MIDFYHVLQASCSWNVLREAITRFLAWVCIGTISFLSLVPTALRPHTVLPGLVEHFTAYAGTGIFLALGYSSWRQRLVAWISIAIASGVFEILQYFVPGRSPKIFDAMASTCGLTFGIISGAVTHVVLSAKKQ